MSITLDNEPQLNSYTTEVVREVIVAVRRASADRAVVAGGAHRRRLARLEARSHPLSPLAGALGAALLGAFRCAQLEQKGRPGAAA